MRRKIDCDIRESGVHDNPLLDAGVLLPNFLPGAPALSTPMRIVLEVFSLLFPCEGSSSTSSFLLGRTGFGNSCPFKKGLSLT